ncbi:MAG TPA: hypothetical protein VJW23_03565 [Propionibacteriaceae bacterium]|nr:hypothetical protein [Propionibacteriaceae bacterium]
MSTYRVTVIVNGTDAGTYTVEAEREGIARTLAAKAMQDARRRGEITTRKSTEAHGIDSYSYVVTEVGA